jgi:hypothetical protein
VTDSAEISMVAPEEVGAVGPEEASPAECIIPSRFLRDGLVAASVGAGVIHVWAANAHFDFTRELVFFVVVAALQLWFAAVVLWVRRIPWSLLIGAAAANAAVVLIWILTRTTGVPGMPKATHMDMDQIMERASKSQHASGFMVHKETFALLDTTCSLLEILVVVGVLMLLWRRRRTRLAGDSGGEATVAAGPGVTGSAAIASPSR